MTTLEVVEVLAQSDKSWEDAAQNAVDDAAKSVRGIKSIYVENFAPNIFFREGFATSVRSVVAATMPTV